MSALSTAARAASQVPFATGVIVSKHQAARTRGERGRDARLEAAEKPGCGEDVADDVRLPRVAGEPRVIPVGPGGSQKIDEPGIVHREQRCVVVRLGVDDTRAGVLERRSDAVGPLGELVRVDPNADPDGGLGRMESVRVAPYDRDREGHALPAEAVLGGDRWLEVRGRRAAGGREDTDDRHRGVAQVLDDVHLPRP